MKEPFSDCLRLLQDLCKYLQVASREAMRFRSVLQQKGHTLQKRSSGSRSILSTVCLHGHASNNIFKMLERLEWSSCFA